MRTKIGVPLSAVLLACSMSTAACSRSLTDITATTSDDVGPWDVANAQVSGNQLKADVCSASSGAADTISDRLLMQLRSKGYQRIELSVFAAEGDDTAQQQVIWTPQEGKQMQPVSRTSDNPCATRQASH
jgi:hypothetical protein